MGDSAGADGQKLSRRDFLRLPGGWGRQFADRFQVGETPTPAPPPTVAPHDRRTRVDVGSVAELIQMAPGRVAVLAEAQGRFFLVRVQEGLLAVARVCNEPGCAVVWQERSAATLADQRRGWTTGRFFCLQHRRTYDRYGAPAEAGQGALDVYRVSQEGDRIVVDPASPLPRSPIGAEGRLGVLTLTAS